MMLSVDLLPIYVSFSIFYFSSCEAREKDSVIEVEQNKENRAKPTLMIERAFRQNRI